MLKISFIQIYAEKFQFDIKKYFGYANVAKE